MTRGLTDIHKVLSKFNETALDKTTQKHDVIYAYYLFFGRSPNQRDFDEKCDRPFATVFQSLLLSEEFLRKQSEVIPYPELFTGADSIEHANFYAWMKTTFGADAEIQNVRDSAARHTNLADISTAILKSETPLKDYLFGNEKAVLRLRKIAADDESYPFPSYERRRKDLFGSNVDDVVSCFHSEDFLTCYQLAVIQTNRFVEAVFEARRKILLGGDDDNTKFRMILDDAFSFLETIRTDDRLSVGDVSVIKALQNSISDATKENEATIFRLRFAPNGAGIAAELYHPEASGSFPSAYLAEIGEEPERFAADISFPSNLLRISESLSRFLVLFQDIGQTLNSRLLFFRLGGEDAEFRLIPLEGIQQATDSEAATPPEVVNILERDGALVFAIEEKPGTRPYRIVLDGKILEPVAVSPQSYDLSQISSSLLSSGQKRFKIYIFDVAGLKGDANLFNLDGQRVWSGEIDFSDTSVAILKQDAVLNPDTLEIEVHYVELHAPDMQFDISVSLERTSPEMSGKPEFEKVLSGRKGLPAQKENLLFSMFPSPRYAIPITAEFVGKTEKIALVSISGSSEQSTHTSLSLQIGEPELDFAFESALASKNTAGARKLFILAATAKFHTWITERIHDHRLNWGNEDRYAIVVKYLLEAGQDKDQQLEYLLNSIWSEEIGSQAFFQNALRQTVALSHEAEEGFESNVFPSTPLKEQSLDGLIAEKSYFASHPDNASASLKLLRNFERTGILANHLATLGARHPENRVVLYERARYEYRQSFQSVAADLANFAITKRKDYREPQLLVQQIESDELSNLKIFALKTNLEGLKLHSPSASVSIDIGRSSLPLMLRYLPTKAALMVNHNELTAITDDRDRIIGKSLGTSQSYSVVFASGTYEATKAFHDAFFLLNTNCKAVMQTQSNWINESAFVGDWVFVFHSKYKITEENLAPVFTEKGPQTGLVVIHTGKYADRGLQLQQIGFLARSQDVADLPRCLAKDAVGLLKERVRSADVYVKAEK